LKPFTPPVVAPTTGREPEPLLQEEEEEEEDFIGPPSCNLEEQALLLLLLLVMPVVLVLLLLLLYIPHPERSTSPLAFWALCAWILVFTTSIGFVMRALATAAPAAATTRSQLTP
jgi:hypothetical protein